MQESQDFCPYSVEAILLLIHHTKHHSGLNCQWKSWRGLVKSRCSFAGGRYPVVRTLTWTHSLWVQSWFHKYTLASYLWHCRYEFCLCLVHGVCMFFYTIWASSCSLQACNQANRHMCVCVCALEMSWVLWCLAENQGPGNPDCDKVLEGGWTLILETGEPGGNACEKGRTHSSGGVRPRGQGGINKQA